MKKLVLLLSTLSVLSCGAQQKKATLTKGDKEFLSKQPDGLYAKFETNRGDIYTELEYKKMPMTVANFVGLAEGSLKNNIKGAGVPYYDGLKFHRIIPGFMIQGGCPNGNGSGDPGYSFDDEMDPNGDLAKTGYVRGVLAMANRGPNTNGSQFFIMHNNYSLPPSYTIFGRTVKGIEVVDSIANAPKDPGDAPLKNQNIIRVIIMRKGKEAEAFDAPKTFEAEKATVAAKVEARKKAEAEAAKIRQAAAQAEAEKILAEKYSNTKTTASGLRYIVVQEGTGKQPNSPNSSVTVHYTGMYLNGEKFDSSLDRGQPATFKLNQVIAGWTEGLQMMKEGGKMKLIIPPTLAWGERGFQGIPPNAWVMFDVELIKAEN